MPCFPVQTEKTFLQTVEKPSWHPVLSINKNLIILKHLKHGIATAQKITFSIKDFFSKCDQIRSFPRI